MNLQGNRHKKRLIVIDSDALLYRAYYALPPLTTKKGELVNAVYGFLLALLKAVKDFSPEYVIASFDFPAPTFRHKEFKEYKSKRAKTPPELREQFPKIKEILKTLKIPIIETEGFEADDIIGTIVKLKNLTGIETIVLTGDSDLLSLADRDTKVYLLKRGVKEAVLYDEKKVREKYQGLEPGQIPDFKGLRGDPSDNIPGVPGVGEKTALFLIKEFGSLENLYQKLKSGNQKIKEPLQKKLLDNENLAFISKSLSKIKQDMPIKIDLNNCRWRSYNKNEVREALTKYEFKTILNKF
ncbi:MAG TPA: hypothetical protein ENL27_01515 [Candidatus Parcubacteria bacterium]|nr:hypothetical protein [Candidatus Parcubacteria bacterium]